jgi:heptosyltransferase-2
VDVDARPLEAPLTGSTLVVAPNWVGDTVMAQPALAALAASGRRLVVLARPHLEPLLALVPGLERTVARGANDAETVERLRGAGCGEAVVLPNSFRSAWLVWRAGIPRRFGYRGGWRSALLAPALARPARGGHQVADYGPLLAAMGVAPGPAAPTLRLGPERQEEGRRLLGRSGVAGERPLVGLFPGAEFGPSKRWSLERFAALSRALRAERPGGRQVIVAGPKEVWLAVRLHELTGKIHPVVGPDLDLGRLAAVLSQLDLLVTNDSGPMHLAAALGVPCVALFGPTDPGRTAPVGSAHRVLYSDRWCSPCFRRRCPLLHHGCMKDLTPEAALAAALEILFRTSG